MSRFTKSFLRTKALGRVLIALMTSLSLFGCGKSPLFNHVMEGERKVTATADTCAFSFPKSGLCASLTWTKQATDDQAGEFGLKFWNSRVGTPTGPFVDPARVVFAKLWMPSMGHGSSPIAISPLKDNSGNSLVGQFKATNVYFVMGGAWELWIQLKDGSQVFEQAKIDLNI